MIRYYIGDMCGNRGAIFCDYLGAVAIGFGIIVSLGYVGFAASIDPE